MRHKLVIFLSLIIVLLCLFIFERHSHFKGYNYFLNKEQNESGILNNIEVFIENEGCALPMIDPWHLDVVKQFDAYINHKDMCIRDFHIVTELKNRTIRVKKRKWKCWGRCVTRKDDHTNYIDMWDPITKTETYECDVVQTMCSKSTFNLSSYSYIHHQIIPKPTERKLNNEVRNYNVFIFGFDSHASSQAFRNFPKVMQFLERGLRSVTFPYVNRVGDNTRPNAMALWFGKSVEAIDKTLFGLGVIPPDWDFWETCSEPLDFHMSLLHDFRKFEYKTLYGEDWPRSMFSHPNCTGYIKQVADHDFQPFVTAASEIDTDKIRFPYSNDLCHTDIQRDMISFWEKFVSTYKDEPKFSWLWFNEPAHNNVTSSVSYDTLFYDFLIKNKKLLENSFVIFLADHGCRTGDTRITPIGELEVNNPMFSMSIPKELRSKEMMEVVRENSRKLQTHFDTRATLLDILEFQPKQKFSSREPFSIPGEKGSSYLRRQLGERSCRTLPIPSSYCLCQFDFKKITDLTSNLALTVGDAVTEGINDKLSKWEDGYLCAPWTLGSVESMYSYPKEYVESYKVIVKMKEPYSNAMFKAVVSRETKDTFHVSRVERLDKYGMMGQCIYQELQQFCFCSSQEAIFELPQSENITQIVDNGVSDNK